MDSRKLVFILFSVVAATCAHAQTAGIVTLRANQTSATGSLTPVLTWSTNPVAQSCRASGGWSGDKAASGTQTLASINASTNYTLTCSWGAGTATVSWSAPTRNTDGTALTNLGSFVIVYGTSANSMTRSQVVSDITARQATIQSLTPGTWYFAARARTTSNVESADSTVGSKNVTGATAAGSVAITITPTTPPPPPPPPPPPTESRLLVARPEVYDLVRYGSGTFVGRQVGTIPVGSVCDSTRRLSTSNWYRVSRSQVKFTRTPRSTDVMARCAWK